MSALHEAVARAIAPWLDAAPKFAHAPDDIRTHRYGRAANAVLAVAEPAIRADERRVVLAEAQRAVEALRPANAATRVFLNEAVDEALAAIAAALGERADA